MTVDERDELDVLLRHAEPAAPAGLQARMLQRAVFERRSRWLYALMAVDLTALAVLPLIALAIGDAVAGAGAGEVLRMLAEDQYLLRQTPNEVLQALMQALPWLLIAALCVDVLVVVLVSRVLLHALTPGGTSDAGRSVSRSGDRT